MAEGEAKLTLVARLRRGEVAAFEEAYEAFRPRIYSFLARLTGNRHAAEDLLQEVWLRLARQSAQLDPATTNLGAWLFAVARNLFVSHRRWRVIDLGRVAAIRLGRRNDDVAPPSPFDLASASETEQRLEAALAALAPPYREVILLVCVEGFEPIEASRILGCSPEALRQRLSRARAMLAALLVEESGAGEDEAKAAEEEAPR